MEKITGRGVLVLSGDALEVRYDVRLSPRPNRRQRALSGRVFGPGIADSIARSSSNRGLMRLAGGVEIDVIVTAGTENSAVVVAIDQAD